jgi:transposase
MDRDELFSGVKRLRAEGKSIRAIVQDLGVHRSTVARALKIPTPPSGEEAVPRPTSGPSPGRLSQGVFVGRQRKMAELQATLEDATSGRGRLVMLVEEPGIGKTRTAAEVG